MTSWSTCWNEFSYLQGGGKLLLTADCKSRLASSEFAFIDGGPCVFPCDVMVIFAIFFSSSCVSCCMRDAEVKGTIVFFHELLEKSAFAQTGRSAPRA